MTKKDFLKSMEILKKYDEWEHQLYQLGVSFWERDEVSNLVTNYINLLELLCKDEIGDIGYFIYETNWGEKADKYYITIEADEREVHFYTAEDLWNYLVELHPDIEEKEKSDE